MTTDQQTPTAYTGRHFAAPDDRPLTNGNARSIWDDDPSPRQHLTPLTWSERCDTAKAEWERCQDAATKALRTLVATIGSAHLPDGTHEQLFVGDVETGDQVLWDDGWWFVTGATHGGRSDEADTVLCVTRVGHDSLDLSLAGNTLLTVVRCNR